MLFALSDFLHGPYTHAYGLHGTFFGSDEEKRYTLVNSAVLCNIVPIIGTLVAGIIHGALAENAKKKYDTSDGSPHTKENSRVGIASFTARARIEKWTLGFAGPLLFVVDVIVTLGRLLCQFLLFMQKQETQEALHRFFYAHSTYYVGFHPEKIHDLRVRSQVEAYAALNTLSWIPLLGTVAGYSRWKSVAHEKGQGEVKVRALTEMATLGCIGPVWCAVDLFFTWGRIATEAPQTAEPAPWHVPVPKQEELVSSTL